VRFTQAVIVEYTPDNIMNFVMVNLELRRKGKSTAEKEVKNAIE